MKKFFTILFALTLTIPLLVSCSDDSSDKTAGIIINSLADDMRQCAPDLASSVITVWADGSNGWSSGVEYGVLKKHFDSDSGSESIYATVTLLDEILSNVMANLSPSALESEGSKTVGDYTVVYELVDGSVNLPSILSDNGVTAVDDFENHMTFTGGDYEGNFYYKSAGDSGTEKLFYRYENSGENETGLIYATRDTSTNDMEVWTACHKSDSTTFPTAGTAHVENDFRCLLYFKGNTDAQNFKFKIKTDAADGWAFWGGGSVASDDNYIVVRGTDTADSDTYANDGSGITDADDATTYVILTFGQMKNSDYNGGGYPLDCSNLAAESESVADYIRFGTDCLHGTESAAQDFVYPEEATELAMPLL
ncbi:MAG TPA: hypothetical protein PK926_03060 [Spirochaetota bacterium]|nr:hypothetical protein [Spirochaetota bacterium]HPI87939.1 hypothetical protein [Spirochaetota bacterium]HPR46649.1 hypothetical protein [Spirochaetota bacterium]